MTESEPIVRDLGLAQYRPVCEAMREFTHARTAQTPDEIWFVEHLPVYTAGRDVRDHPSRIAEIPVIDVERGGDLTYHAPGQMVVYPLLDLRRRGLLVRPYVELLLRALSDTLASFGIVTVRQPEAPGLYVPMPGGVGMFQGKAKIASVGIRISRGCTFHGVSLNVNMDLTGFRRIHPCGYSGLRVTDMNSLGIRADMQTVKERYRLRLLSALFLVDER